MQDVEQIELYLSRLFFCCVFKVIIYEGKALSGLTKSNTGMLLVWEMDLELAGENHKQPERLK